jgi:ATP-dependent DNA helicase RecG
MLKKELAIFTFGDLLEHFPNRHIDKTRVNKISEINPQTDYIQVAGTLSIMKRSVKEGAGGWWPSCG